MILDIYLELVHGRNEREELEKLILNYRQNSQLNKLKKIKDIPSISVLERKLLFTNLPSQLDAELEGLVDRTSIEIFGITEEQTQFHFPENYDDLPMNSDKRWQITEDYDEHEQQYITSDYGDEDAAIFLVQLGLDFYDENGNPLRCIRYLKRQAEIAAKGIMGKLPDMAAINEARQEESMRAEASAFQRKKHGK